MLIEKNSDRESYKGLVSAAVISKGRKVKTPAKSQQNISAYNEKTTNTSRGLFLT